MIEVLRFEVGQMLGGRKKWFVALFLCLPIVLAALARSLGERAGSALDGETQVVVPPDYVEVPLEVPEATLAGGRLHYRDGTLFVKRGVLEVPAFTFRDGVLRWNDQAVSYLRIGPQGAIYERGRLFVHQEFDPARIRSVHWRSAEVDLEDLDPDVISGILLFLIYPQTLCILLALLYGASLLAAELEAKTLTYLFTRPLSRATILWGKVTAVVLALSPPTIASLAVSWLVLGMPGGFAYLGALATATVLGLCAYNALFLLVGLLLPTRAMVSCLVYAVVFEFVLSFVPALVNMLTVTYHLRSIGVALSGFELPSFLRRIVAGDAGPSWIGVACIVVISLLVAGEIAKRREYVVTEQV